MRIVDIAVKRPVAVAMFTFAILLFGMVALNRLSVNLLPDLSYPTLTIRTAYTGAAPAEVEQLVSKPIEEAIGVVKAVRNVKSVSRAEQSDVVLQFAWGTDMDFASLEVREKLDILQLPLDVDKPRLLRFNPSFDPVLKMGLGFNEVNPPSDQASFIYNMKAMRLFAEKQIKRELESIEGVASVKIGGGLEDEIQILIDQRKASQLNINVNTIVDRLKSENVNVAGGRINDGSQTYLVRTLNQFASIEEIEKLYVGNIEGRAIQLKDIAFVVPGYKERDAVTRFDGIEGIEIAIYKEGDANAVDVSKRVQARVDSIKESMPKLYGLQTTYDQSVFINQAIEDVKAAAIVGGMLAMLVLYLFLRDFWPTLIISISIPVSVIATFNLMYANDISLNIMSLGGIALAVGLLVDNSIVVLENIDRHKQKQRALENADDKTAAAEGTKEVSSAIVASTLTTLAVFVPLIFVEGIAGQLFRDQAMTVSFALLASLVIAITLIPCLASRKKSNTPAHADLFLNNEKNNKPKTTFAKVLYWTFFPITFLLRFVFVYLPASLITLAVGLWRIVSRALHFIFIPVASSFNLCFKGIEKCYDGLLRIALKTRGIVLALTLAITAGAFLLIPKLGTELIPTMSQGEFFVDLTLPTGSTVRQTDQMLANLARQTEALDQVSRTYSLAGTGSLLSASPTQGGDHWGRLNVVMKSGVEADGIITVKKAMRNYLAREPGVQSTFGEPELFSFSAPIQIELQGYDLNQLQINSKLIQQRLSESSRFADVTRSLREGTPELKVVFDHPRLAQLNLNAADISELIATQIGGSVATQFSYDDRKIDVLVRTSENQRKNVQDIRAIIINPESSQPIPLGAVAEVFMSSGPSEITRVGQQRVVLIEANLAYGDLNEGVAEAQNILNSITLPVTLKATIAGQSEDMQHSFSSLQFALVLAVFLVYLVMASQFESLLHPLLILFSMPLAAAGSIYGLWLTGTTVSVVVFIGLIMLSGIVVNNAIVLVDRINQLRSKGVEKHYAIIDAAKSRLRPIVMTSMTTILGLMPLAIGFGDGAEVRAPMAITVISGLLFATLLTLVLIPVLYSLFDVKRFTEQTSNKLAQPNPNEERTYG
ncbi:efflux RND transporter permease subunit [Alteromonas sp. ASW11-130]|uniref:efflux RND transporter permease subunit n=1 Tax=Alteromonas sp. ASW11-130 TaxID=3015775 RepID=UPI0022418ED0|nr:efflux RND transporter permease subunit [Alteromonas sp. ASW11-130]MCW8092036.1 efflux RND transporter permease subunit [Alteromonas sp. ASW11-130]